MATKKQGLKSKFEAFHVPGAGNCPGLVCPLALDGDLCCVRCEKMRKIKMPVADEHTEQVALCRWWAVYAASRGIPESLLFAIPNGGRRDAVTGARLKAEGVRAGVPDLFLAIPRKNAPGLFLELKKQKGGQLSGAQKKMRDALSLAGYPVCVCRGWEQARQAIENYMGWGAEINNFPELN